MTWAAVALEEAGGALVVGAAGGDAVVRPARAVGDMGRVLIVLLELFACGRVEADPLGEACMQRNHRPRWAATEEVLGAPVRRRPYVGESVLDGDRIEQPRASLQHVVEEERSCSNGSRR